MSIPLIVSAQSVQDHCNSLHNILTAKKPSKECRIDQTGGEADIQAALHVLGNWHVL